MAAACVVLSDNMSWLHTFPLWVNIFHDVLKSKLTSIQNMITKLHTTCNIKIQLHNCTHISHKYTQQVIFHIWLMLLGSVEESGYQHAQTHHLNLYLLYILFTKLAKQQTVWIHLSNLTCSFCFQCKSLQMLCHCGQSKQSLTKCNVFFFNVQMSCIPMYSFESQSSQVQLITLKAPTCPTFYEWGWICYRLRVIFNLKHYNIQITHTKIRTTCPSLWNSIWTY